MKWGVWAAGSVACALALAIPTAMDVPPAWADDVVTYEVVSDHVGVATIEWQDIAGRMVAHRVSLPWRADVTVRSAEAPPPEGSQIRADWRPSRAPARWVTVRIFYRGELICQNTLDVGNAACYGATRRVT